MTSTNTNIPESTSKRSSSEIIDLIYGALPVESYDPVSKIAERAGLDWRTTKRYLDLILQIQSKHDGGWLVSKPFGEGEGYARLRKKG